MRKLLLGVFVSLCAIVLFSCSSEAVVDNVVGNEAGVGYISIKLPPLGNGSRAVSNADIKAAVGDYTLVLMSHDHTSTTLKYSEQENGFDRVALPVGTYQIILTAEAVGKTYGASTEYSTVGIAYAEDIVIEEFKMTKVSMTLSAPELTIELPEEDIYVNSSIIARVKFSIKGLPSRLNSYVRYTPHIFQEVEQNEKPFLNKVLSGTWKSGKYGEFIDLPCPAPSVEGDYILGLDVAVGIGYADGNNNVLVGRFSFLGYGVGFSNASAYLYYNENIAVADQIYSVPFSVTVPPTGMELNVGWNDETYTVLFATNGNGFVSCASIEDIERDTVLVVDDATITIGETVVTATPDSGYVFNSWSGLPAGNKIIENTNISAVFIAE